MNLPAANDESFDVLSEILQVLKSNQKMDRLWDAQDIADFMKLSKASVQQRVLCLPDFPSAIKIPTGTATKKTYTDPRWDPQDVIPWIKQFKLKKQLAKKRGRPRAA